MPVGAFGGKREIMQHLAPLGTVYQAGTLSGNPVAMAAGLATLNLISEPSFFLELSVKTQNFVQDLLGIAQEVGVPMQGVAVGGMFGLFFSESTQPITNFDQVMQCNVARFKQFFHIMLEAGIYLAPSAFEAGFISAAHSVEDIDFTLGTAKKVLISLK
jgi:glutamate-1-semialdehyde 2,1-aminomutase